MCETEVPELFFEAENFKSFLNEKLFLLWWISIMSFGFIKMVCLDNSKLWNRVPEIQQQQTENITTNHRKASGRKLSWNSQHLLGIISQKRILVEFSPARSTCKMESNIWNCQLLIQKFDHVFSIFLLK